LSKRIFMVNRTLGNGGIERNTLNLSNRLIENGYEVHIILLSNIVMHDVNPKIKLHILENFLKNPFSIFIRALNKILPIISLELIANYYKNIFLKELKKLEDTYGKANTIFIHGFGAYSCLYKIQDERFIISSRNTKSAFIKTKAPQILHFMIKKTLRKMLDNKIIIAVSEGIKNDWLNNIKIKPKSIVTIYNPIDFNMISEKSEATVDYINPYILHVGRFVKEKRHDLLLESFSKIENKEIHLLLLGNGPLQNSIIEIIEKLNLSKRVTLLGFDTNPYKWMKNAKLLVLASDHEGLPTVLIEALVCKTTVVSTNCPSGPDEILMGTLSEYLVEVNNSKALTNKINYALKNKISFINGLERFDSKHIIQQYINLIEG